MGWRIAWPLGWRHAGHRDEGLLAVDVAARLEPEHAPDRAPEAGRWPQPVVRIHRGRSDDLDEAMDGAGPHGEVGRADLRIRLPRGQLRHDGYPQRRSGDREE